MKRAALGTAIAAAHTSIGKLLNAAYNVTFEAGKHGNDRKTLGMIDKKDMLLPTGLLGRVPSLEKATKLAESL